jgi:hypothetical protein
MFQRGKRRSRISSNACISSSRRSKGHVRNPVHHLVSRSRRCRPGAAFHSSTTMAYMTMTIPGIRAHVIMTPGTKTVMDLTAVPRALHGATCMSIGIGIIINIIIVTMQVPQPTTTTTATEDTVTHRLSWQSHATLHPKTTRHEAGRRSAWTSTQRHSGQKPVRARSVPRTTTTAVLTC